MDACMEKYEAGSVHETVPEKRCYTVEELQIMLNASRKTVYRLIESNVFHSFRLGPNGKYRISKKSFDEWLESKMQDVKDVNSESTSSTPV